MPGAAASPSRELVLVGGGHAHVEVLRGLGMEPPPGVRLTLVSKDRHAPYSGMLPGLVAGHYRFEQTHVDLVPLARFAGARFVHAAVTGVDRAQRRLRLEDGAPLRYDVASLDVGATPALAGVPGAAEHVVPVKPIAGFLRRWERLRERVLASEGPLRLGAVGGGAGGVELLLAVQHRLRRELAGCGADPERLRCALYTEGDDVLLGHNRVVRARFRRVLRRRGVALHLGARVVRVERGRLHLAGGGEAAADEILWVTRAAPAAWFRESGLPTDDAGFVAVRDTLQLTDDDDLFAVGDCAGVLAHPRPKAGVFAVRQGPPLLANLRRRLRGDAAEPFAPQRGFLALISTGDRNAVMSRGPLAAWGRWAWRWKDRIDRRFMRRYQSLGGSAAER